MIKLKSKDGKAQTAAEHKPVQSNAIHTGVQIIDNRNEAAAQRRAQQQADSSSRAIKVAQLQAMTNRQMQDAGFIYMGNQRWQYDEAGYHVSAIRANGEVTHFHVVGRWRGGDYNRIDYDEGANNTWAEAIVNQDRPDDIAAMRDIARRTAPFFGGRLG